MQRQLELQATQHHAEYSSCCRETGVQQHNKQGLYAHRYSPCVQSAASLGVAGQIMLHLRFKQIGVCNAASVYSLVDCGVAYVRVGCLPRKMEMDCILASHIAGAPALKCHTSHTRIWRHNCRVWTCVCKQRYFAFVGTQYCRHTFASVAQQHCACCE